MSTSCIQYKVKNTFVEIDIFEDDDFINEMVENTQRQISEPTRTTNYLMDELLNPRNKISKQHDIWIGKHVDSSEDMVKQAELSEPEKEPDFTHSHGDNDRYRVDNSIAATQKLAKEIASVPQVVSERHVLCLSAAFTNIGANSNSQLLHHDKVAASAICKKSRRRKRDSLIDQAAKQKSQEVQHLSPIQENIGAQECVPQANVRENTECVKCPRCGGGCSSGHKFCKFCGFAISSLR